jgi:pimeloyl-ACP methyl ester carboxylesterase
MDQTRSADGTVIAFEKLGNGPPLILVGGAFSDHRVRAAGLPLARAIAESLTVFCYDRRGRGGSGDTPPYAVAREIEDLAALLAVAGGSAHVYGHSSGAILAFEAALARLPIVKLALYEPPIVVSQDRSPLPTDLAERLLALTTENKRSEAVELFLTRAVGVPEAAVLQRKGSPHWAELEAMAHTLSYEACLARDPVALLARARELTQPTLVLDGEQSQAWMRFGAAKLTEAIPGARRVSLPGQTHDVDPVALAPHLLELFAPQ